MNPTFLKHFFFPVLFLLVFQGEGRGEVFSGFGKEVGEETAACVKEHSNEALFLLIKNADNDAARIRYSHAWNHLDLAESSSKLDPTVLTKLGDDLLDSDFATFLEGGVGRVKAWEAFANDGLPSVFRTNITNLNQRTILDEWADNIADASNARKGNFGEIGADLDLNAKGYTSLQPRIDGIDSPGHNGIDVVVEKDGQYFIVEGKYTGSAALNPADPETGLPRQMSDDWILQNNGQRLLEALGGNQSLVDDILDSGYSRILAKTNPNGTVSYQYVSETGYLNQGGGPLGEWIP